MSDTPAVGSTQNVAKLAMAAQVLLVVNAVLSLAIICIETLGIIAVDTFLDGDLTTTDWLYAYDASSALVGVLAALLYSATGVIWVIWQFRSAKQVTGRTRRTPGWHVGSWLVPITYFWHPYQNISDLWRAAGRIRPSWLIVWWLLFLGSRIVGIVSVRIYLEAEDLETMRVAMCLSLASEVLLLAAAPMAWLILRGITRGILRQPVAAASPHPGEEGGDAPASL